MNHSINSIGSTVQRPIRLQYTLKSRLLQALILMVLTVQLALCKLEDNTDVVHVVEILAFESNHEIHF